MTNLIAVVVAVVLMAAVALAGLSYLGPSMMAASTEAVVARVLNAGAQIQGAETLRQAEQRGFALDGDKLAVDVLTAEGYLRAAPQPPASIVLPGSSWTAVEPTPGAAPILSLKLDRSKPEAIAFCQELTRRSSGTYGCTSDITSVH